MRIAWGLFPFPDHRLKSCHRNYLTWLFVETFSDAPDVFCPRRLLALSRIRSATDVCLVQDKFGPTGAESLAVRMGSLTNLLIP